MLHRFFFLVCCFIVHFFLKSFFLFQRELWYSLVHVLAFGFIWESCKASYNHRWRKEIHRRKHWRECQPPRCNGSKNITHTLVSNEIVRKINIPATKKRQHKNLALTLRLKSAFWTIWTNVFLGDGKILNLLVDFWVDSAFVLRPHSSSSRWLMEFMSLGLLQIIKKRYSYIWNCKFI